MGPRRTLICSALQGGGLCPHSCNMIYDSCSSDLYIPPRFLISTFLVALHANIFDMINWSHPQSQPQAHKGVSRVGLEAQLLTLEHLLVKRYCCEYYEETVSCYRLLDPTLKTSSRFKKVSPG